MSMSEQIIIESEHKSIVESEFEHIFNLIHNNITIDTQQIVTFYNNLQHYEIDPFFKLNLLKLNKDGKIANYNFLHFTENLKKSINKSNIVKNLHIDFNHKYNIKEMTPKQNKIFKLLDEFDSTANEILTYNEIYNKLPFNMDILFEKETQELQSIIDCLINNNYNNKDDNQNDIDEFKDQIIHNSSEYVLSILSELTKLNLPSMDNINSTESAINYVTARNGSSIKNVNIMYEDLKFYEQMLNVMKDHQTYFIEIYDFIKTVRNMIILEQQKYNINKIHHEQNDKLYSNLCKILLQSDIDVKLLSYDNNIITFQYLTSNAYLNNDDDININKINLKDIICENNNHLNKELMEKIHDIFEKRNHILKCDKEINNNDKTAILLLQIFDNIPKIKLYEKSVLKLKNIILELINIV
jgi:hypothetical protein